jgi:hypothetical protein
MTVQQRAADLQPWPAKFFPECSRTRRQLVGRTGFPTRHNLQLSILGDFAGNLVELGTIRGTGYQIGTSGFPSSCRLVTISSADKCMQ